jgi:hypothetical protein
MNGRAAPFCSMLGIALAFAFPGRACAAATPANVAPVVVEPERVVFIVARFTPAPPPPEHCSTCERDCSRARDNWHGDDYVRTELDNLCVVSGWEYWYRARVQQVVLGGPVPAEIPFMLEGDYGPRPSRSDDSRTWLVRAHPGRFWYSSGSRKELHVSSRGELYLLLDEGEAPLWLPCSVGALREEIAAKDFRDAWQPLAKLSPYQRQDIAAGRADHLRVDARGASPRYGISLRRLAEHLRSLGANLTDDVSRCSSTPAAPP